MINNFLSETFVNIKLIVNTIISSFVGIVGVLCLFGFFNPINIPDKSETIVIKDVVDSLQVEKYYVSIVLNSFNKYELKFLKSAGDYRYFIEKVNKNNEFTFKCFNSKVHFNVHGGDKYCYVFEVVGGSGYIVKMEDTVRHASEINFYVIIVGIIFIVYSLINLFLLLSRKPMANKIATKFGLR